jgi:hypothetical protein
VVEEGQGVVSEEGDYEVVYKGDKVERVSNHEREPGIHIRYDPQSTIEDHLPVIPRNNGHKQELDKIQKHPYGYKRPYRHVPAISKLELTAVRVFDIEEALSPAPGEAFDARTQETADEEVEEGRYEEREEEEVDEDEGEHYAYGAWKAVGVGETPG